MAGINDQAKIILDFRCNNSCVFCHEKRNSFLPGKNTEDIFREIKIAKKRNKKELHLMGGEPTIRPDIFDIIAYARNIGFKYVRMTTNGRMFCYPSFAKKIIDAGLSSAIISVHGHSAEVHDQLTGGAGSFCQLSDGIINLRKLGFNGIGTNTTITSANLRNLPDIAKFLLKNKIENATFIYVISPTDKMFRELTPLVGQAGNFIIKTLEMGRKKGYAWHLLNPPMGCYFSKNFDLWVRYGDSKNEELFGSTKTARMIFRVSKKKVIDYAKIEKCSSCVINKKCLGVWKSYLKSYGAREIRPILK